MAAPYLVEIRTGGEVKHRLREIMYDIANRFNVRGAVEPRPVPHVTLYGPYDTNRGREVKQALISVLSEYDVVPYRIDGFDTFADKNVIYANVIPSQELRSLRRDVTRELRPLTYDARPWDSKYFYDFHITVAFKDVGSKFDDILDYVTERYEPRFDEYALRVTSLRRRNMLWEYDLLQDEVLDSDEATSASTWERSEELLETNRTPEDHEELFPKPGLAKRYGKWTWAKLTGQW